MLDPDARYALGMLMKRYTPKKSMKVGPRVSERIWMYATSALGPWTRAGASRDTAIRQGRMVFNGDAFYVGTCMLTKRNTVSITKIERVNA